MSLLTPGFFTTRMARDPAWKGIDDPAELKRGGFRKALIAPCANPNCGSGWLHLFRKRNSPVFEGGWTCSPECTEVRINMSLLREVQGGRAGREQHRHRIPIGLLMLEHGWITHCQLRNALKCQRKAGKGRIGEWLIQQHAVDEPTVARALGLQWSCPVLKPNDQAGEVAHLLPRQLIELTGALPLRVGTDNLIYLAFEANLDPVVALALQRVIGSRVECGIVPSSVFHKARARAMASAFPHVQVAEAANVPVAAHLLARAVERAQPIASQLVRVHQYLWLRMWFSQDAVLSSAPSGTSDVLCTIGAI